MKNHHQLNSNIVDASFIGKKITARVSYLCAGNSCWSTVLIERASTRVNLQARYDWLWYWIGFGPEVVENCGPVTINELDHKRVQVACNQDIIAYDIKTYQAKDKYGNLSKIWWFSTSYVRGWVHLDSVMLDSMTLHYSLGFWLCSWSAGKSYTWQNNAYFSCSKPLMSNYECNIHVKYTDIVISTDRCVKKKIIQNWAIYEWW